MKTHKEIFTEIYDKNVWGGSGGGSSPENTVEYRALLQRFLSERQIDNVVDFGCGDWGFSRLIDWSGVIYMGYDVVDSVVKKNIISYSNGYNIFFTTNIGVMGLWGNELLIVKDVLQHWESSEIVAFLDAMKYFKYILITNTQGESEVDIQRGQCRGLSAKFEPLKKYKPEILAVIKTTIVSEVSLITNR